MKVRPAFAAIGLVVVCLGLAVPIRAHRLDEYLQAARISVGTDRVSLELDLTPGIAIAPAVLAMIDTDRNGQLSSAESDAYAIGVINSVVMKVDGQPLRPRLDRRQMPAWSDVNEGTGTIRLTASAPLPALTEGPHSLVYSNRHRSEIGVYLANALVPDDPRIEITAQRRDVAQHELTIDYSIGRGTGRPAVNAWQSAVAIAIVAMMGGIFLQRKMTRGA